MSIPEPQTKWPASQSLQPLDVFGDSYHRVSHFSPRGPGHSAHPTRDIPGRKGPMQAGVRGCAG